MCAQHPKDHYCFAFAARLYQLLESEGESTIANAAFLLAPENHPGNQWLKSDVGFHFKGMWKSGLLTRKEGFRLKYSINSQVDGRQYFRNAADPEIVRAIYLVQGGKRGYLLVSDYHPDAIRNRAEYAAMEVQSK